MHAWKFPEHERRLTDLARAAGFTQVSASHQVSALLRLVPRGDTTVVDAYLSPILRRYVDHIATELEGVRLYFMQSSGGLADAMGIPGQGRDPVRAGRRHCRRGPHCGGRRFRPDHQLRHGRHLNGRGALRRRIRAGVRDAGGRRPHAGPDDGDQHGGGTRDLQGRLVACEHDSRRVTRQEADGSITVVANSFQGRQLNRPNDVVVRSDGCIYFTDPWSSPAAPEQWDLQYSGVYRVTPDLGTLSLLADDFVLPNGLAFSPDESVLYINDTRRGHIRAFELLPSGMLAKVHRPGVRRSARRRARRTRRHEGRCRGQRLLRRRGRHLGHGLLLDIAEAYRQSRVTEGSNPVHSRGESATKP